MTAYHSILDASRPHVVISSMVKCDWCPREIKNPTEKDGWRAVLIDPSKPFLHHCPSPPCKAAAASAVKQRSYARR